MKNETVNMTLGVYRRLYAALTRGKRINRVSLFAELLFWRLHCVSDDFGNFSASPDMILVDAFPFRKSIKRPKIVTALNELKKAHLISTYEVEEESFGTIVDFQKFQPAGKNGRRIQRFPFNEKESGGIRGIQEIQKNPIQSSPPHTDTDTDTNTESESEAGDALPPGVKYGRRAVESILAAYPLKKSLGGAERNVVMALDKISARGIDDPVAFLLERVQAFAKSDEGKRTKKEVRWWMEDGRYDDDPETWKKSVESKSASNTQSESPTYTDAPMPPSYFENVSKLEIPTLKQAKEKWNVEHGAGKSEAKPD